MSKRKFLKSRKIRVDGNASRGNTVAFGCIALKVAKSCKIKAKTIETARSTITRSCSRRGKLIIRVNPNRPVSKKPLEVRMGSGKGSIDHYVAALRAGTVIFEMSDVPLDVARKAFQSASYKLNAPCIIEVRKFIYPSV